MNGKEQARKPFAAYIRTFVFGVEDSLVSTAGLISGIAAAGVPQLTILITGTILIFVEAFSMAVGSILSENSAEEYEERKDVPLSRSFDEGVVMFFSYFISGFVPLAPYLFLDIPSAFVTSILLSLGALYALGAASGKISHASIAKTGMRMLVLGGIAVIVGVVIGGLAR